MSKIRDYLFSNGWRMVIDRIGKYGNCSFWEPPDFENRKEDGRWYTQTEAVRKQRELDKQ